jgi:hypothetical protein
VLIESATAEHATRRATELGINPGGDVAAVEFAPGVEATEGYRERLLNRDEAGVCDELMDRRYRSE